MKLQLSSRTLGDGETEELITPSFGRRDVPAIMVLATRLVSRRDSSEWYEPCFEGARNSGGREKAKVFSLIVVVKVRNICNYYNYL